MNIWIVVQLMVNLVLFAGMLFLLMNRKQTQKDDQKFSKGLQLLQNKISVLEDLSDQTDEQVRSLTQLLEAKYREIQGLLVDSDQQIQKMEEIARNIWAQVESSSALTGGSQSSNEVQSMNKYVKAAQMANAGKSIDDVVREIDITRGEAELIVAMNKDQLTFNQNTLPLWVQPDKAAAPQASTVGAEFLKALKNNNMNNANSVHGFIDSAAPQIKSSGYSQFQGQPQGQSQTQSQAYAQAYNQQQQIHAQAQQPVVPAQNQTPKLMPNGKLEPKIRPFEFRRIDLG